MSRAAGLGLLDYPLSRVMTKEEGSYSAPRQSPACSCLAACAASASGGSDGTVGSAQPWRTIQVERPVPATVQRAAKSFCSPLLGSSHVTARVRIRCVSAPRAAAPHRQGLPSLPLQVASASRAAVPTRL